MTEFKNYFTFSNEVKHLLFKDISVSSNEAMFGLCVGVAVFTFIFEAVKSLRHYLVILQIKRNRDTQSDSIENTIKDTHNVYSAVKKSPRKSFNKLKWHCFQTILHMLQLAMGYMVMLILMSYNAWLLITIISTTAICFYFHEYLLSTKSMLPLEIPETNL